MFCIMQLVSIHNNLRCQKLLITGITGQDGSYLTELLLTKNYKIHGFVRKKFNFNKWKTNSLKKKITLHKVDFNNQKEIEKKIRKIKPHEVYHLAAQSHDGHHLKMNFIL